MNGKRENTVERTISTPCHSPGEIDPDIWYSDARRKQRQAKAACAACPMRQQCLSQALVEGEEWGIWGGLTTSERESLKERLSATPEAGRAGAAA